MQFDPFGNTARSWGLAGLLAVGAIAGCSEQPASTPTGPQSGVPGPGMMGPGQGVGPMAGPGMGGPGMGAPGMMGPGMMGGDPNAPDDYTGEFPEGRKVFRAQGCGRCHGVGGGQAVAGGPPGGPPGGAPGGAPGGGPPGGGPPGGMPMGRGPDLAQVGADPEHTKEWLASFVKNPKSIKENARMPGFEGRINDEDLAALVDYLASLQ